MSAPPSSLLGLPLDVLVLIFPHLDAPSFLSLCRTCKALYKPSIRLDPAYWGHAIQTAFRVPNQPVVRKDGNRLYHLYRRLRTQSRAFTWGSNGHGCLGHSHDPGQLTAHSHGRFFERKNGPDGHPLEMEGTQELGIIADMQCGGWSTTLLTSKGILYTVGVLDGLATLPGHDKKREKTLQQHIFPVGYPSLKERSEPFVTIKQFSAGRAHILGLSDSGRIWFWYSAQMPGLQIRFVHTDIVEDTHGQKLYRNNRVSQVVAGWEQSSAYITGVGIIVWLGKSDDNSARPPVEDEEIDTILVLESTLIPQTGYTRSRNPSDEDRRIGEEIGAVTNYIMLENYVVFITDIGKVFASNISSEPPEIIELKALRCDLSDAQATTPDVQGSFRTFAVLHNDEVTIVHQDYLNDRWAARHSLTPTPTPSSQPQPATPGLHRIPALQRAGVIQLAFGDWHFHALHSSGHVTSYGKSPQTWGAFGFGRGEVASRLRGVRRAGADQVLAPHAYARLGRAVWFDDARRRWLRWLASGARNPQAARPWLEELRLNEMAAGEVSEWIEQESRDWDRFEDVKREDDDGLGSHFVLRVSAAGWHSGAVVLVNEELAERVRRHFMVPYEGKKDDLCENGWVKMFDTYGVPGPTREELVDAGEGVKYKWADESMPRVRLSDGSLMPGDGPEVEWRFGPPEWHLEEQPW